MCILLVDATKRTENATDIQYIVWAPGVMTDVVSPSEYCGVDKNTGHRIKDIYAT